MQLQRALLPSNNPLMAVNIAPETIDSPILQSCYMLISMGRRSC